MTEGRPMALEPKVYMEVLSEDLHSTVDVTVVLKTQVRQLETLVEAYREHFGELPQKTDSKEATT